MPISLKLTTRGILVSIEFPPELHNSEGLCDIVLASTTRHRIPPNVWDVQFFIRSAELWYVCRLDRFFNILFIVPYLKHIMCPNSLEKWNWKEKTFPLGFASKIYSYLGLPCASFMRLQTTKSSTSALIKILIDPNFKNHELFDIIMSYSQGKPLYSDQICDKEHILLE